MTFLWILFGSMAFLGWFLAMWSLYKKARDSDSADQ